MKKKDFIDAIMEDYDLSKAVAIGVYSTLTGMIAKAVKNEETIDLGDFCRITVRKTKKRKGRNPFTGESIIIPAKKKLKINPKPALKNIVNPKKKVKG